VKSGQRLLLLKTTAISHLPAGRREVKRLESSYWGHRVLLTFFGLFVLDWMFTMYLLELGAVEANPLMSPLIEASPFSALLLKVLVGGVAALVFYRQWHIHWVRLAVTSVTMVYAVLVGYELFCMLFW
jgi:hypothetical protein